MLGVSYLGIPEIRIRSKNGYAIVKVEGFKSPNPKFKYEVYIDGELVMHGHEGYLSGDRAIRWTVQGLIIEGSHFDEIKEIEVEVLDQKRKFDVDDELNVRHRVVNYMVNLLKERGLA